MRVRAVTAFRRVDDGWTSRSGRHRWRDPKPAARSAVVQGAAGEEAVELSLFELHP